MCNRHQASAVRERSQRKRCGQQGRYLAYRKSVGLSRARHPCVLGLPGKLATFIGQCTVTVPGLCAPEQSMSTTSWGMTDDRVTQVQLRYRPLFGTSTPAASGCTRATRRPAQPGTPRSLPHGKTWAASRVKEIVVLNPAPAGPAPGPPEGLVRGRKPGSGGHGEGGEAGVHAKTSADSPGGGEAPAEPQYA